MNVNHAIDLNVSATGMPPVLKMAQYDANSRTIVATLWNGASKFVIPSDASVMVRFGKPDGTGGLYDETEAGDAITFSDNVVTAPVAAQMLSVAGSVKANIEIYQAGETEQAAVKLATFCFVVNVERAAYSDAEMISSDYYNIMAEQIQQAISAGQVAASAITAAAQARSSASLAESAASRASSSASLAESAASRAGQSSTSANASATSARQYANQARSEASKVVTPSIGANGNWYLGNTDTGKPARGPAGTPGKAGTDGTPGIVVSSEEPTDPNHPVWLDPDGDATPDNPLDITGAAVGQIVKIAAVDDDGVPTAWETIDGYTGQVTVEKINNPDHVTDLVQYAAFQAAVPLVQQMNISGAKVGQIIKVKAVDTNGHPTQWEAADMPSGGGSEEWELINSFTVSEENASRIIKIDKDSSGNAFSLKAFAFIANTNSTKTDGSLYGWFCVNGRGTYNSGVCGFMTNFVRHPSTGAAIYNDVIGRVFPFGLVYETVTRRKADAGVVGHTVTEVHEVELAGYQYEENQLYGTFQLWGVRK